VLAFSCICEISVDSSLRLFVLQKCQVIKCHLEISSEPKRWNLVVLNLADVRLSYLSAIGIALAPYSRLMLAPGMLQIASRCPPPTSSWPHGPVCITHFSLSIHACKPSLPLLSASKDPSGHDAQLTSGNRTAISPDCVMYLTQGREGYCSCKLLVSTDIANIYDIPLAR
jgi:hypothetical protein